MRQSVSDLQKKSKAYADNRRCAKDKSLRVADAVRIRKPWKTGKMEKKYSAPKQVVNRKGPHTWMLSDGTVWNTSHLVSVTTKNELDGEGISASQSESSACGRPVRNRHLPTWTKDYVLYS